MPGYRTSFFTDLQEDMLCPECQSVLKNPYKQKCGHHFCEDCIQYPFTCPLDKENTSKGDEIYSDDLQKKISESQVVCPHKDCGWHGSQKNFLQDHSEKCIYISSLIEKVKVFVEKKLPTNNLTFEEIKDSAVTVTDIYKHQFYSIQEELSLKNDISNLLKYVIRQYIVNSNEFLLRFGDFIYSTTAKSSSNGFHEFVEELEELINISTSKSVAREENNKISSSEIAEKAKEVAAIIIPDGGEGEAIPSTPPQIKVIKNTEIFLHTRSEKDNGDKDSKIDERFPLGEEESRYSIQGKKVDYYECTFPKHTLPDQFKHFQALSPNIR